MNNVHIPLLLNVPHSRVKKSLLYHFSGILFSYILKYLLGSLKKIGYNYEQVFNDINLYFSPC